MSWVGGVSLEGTKGITEGEREGGSESMGEGEGQEGGDTMRGQYTRGKWRVRNLS